MKVLQVLHQFLPRHMAGSEIYTYHLSRELLKRHEVHLVCTERHPGEPLHSVLQRNYQGIPITEIVNNHESLTFETTYLNCAIDDVFEDVLESQKPDVVHFQHLALLSMNLPRIARRRGIPVVMTLHEYWYQCPANGQRLLADNSLCREVDLRKCASCVRSSPYVFRGKRRFAEPPAASPGPLGWFQNKFPAFFKAAGDEAAEAIEWRTRIMRDALEQCNLLIAPSEFLRQEFIRWGIPAAQIIYSDYGFDKAPFRHFEKIASEKIRFAFIGSLMPHKGVDLLVDAFRGLPPERTSLDIYGNPEVRPAYVAELKKAAEGLPVRFLGEWSTHQIQEAYREIDVLVVPSRWFENSPLTIHEALMAGVPVITSNMGGMAELVREDRDGLLFEPNSSADLRRRMLEILERPDLLKADLSRGAPVKSIEDDALFHEELYQRVIQAEAGRKTSGAFRRT